LCRTRDSGHLYTDDGDWQFGTHHGGRYVYDHRLLRSTADEPVVDCSDAVTFDQQAAAESAISCLMAALSGANLVHDVGFTDAANLASLELIAATDEFIGMVRAIMEDVPVTPETLALEIIERVGPGGSYLGDRHTIRHLREGWFPRLLNRGNYEQWTAAGGQPFGDKANQRVRQILRTHEPVPLPTDVVAELDTMEQQWWKEAS
jgi:trimethylamine--corrinoid protein Co-methyltransferase